MAEPFADNFAEVSGLKITRVVARDVACAATVGQERDLAHAVGAATR